MFHSYLKNLHNGPMTCLCTYGAPRVEPLAYLRARTWIHNECSRYAKKFFISSQPSCNPLASSTRVTTSRGLKVFAIVREDHKYTICRGQTTPRYILRSGLISSRDSLTHSFFFSSPLSHFLFFIFIF